MERIAIVAPDGAGARAALARYYAEIDALFDGGFEVGRSADPALAALRPPVGAFLLAGEETAPVGCVALKGVDAELAEIKRLWVAPEARGRGLAGRLMAAAERVARDQGRVQLRLDTNRALGDVAAWYARAGWSPIARFTDDPYADYFFGKEIG